MFKKVAITGGILLVFIYALMLVIKIATNNSEPSFIFIVLLTIYIAILIVIKQKEKRKNAPCKKMTLYEALMVNGDEAPSKNIQKKEYILLSQYLKKYNEHMLPAKDILSKFFDHHLPKHTIYVVQEEEDDTPSLSTRLARKYYIQNGIQNDQKKTNLGDIVEMNEFLPGEKLDTVDMLWLDDDIQHDKKKAKNKDDRW